MNDDINMRETDIRRRAEIGEIDEGRMEERDDTIEDIDETEHSRSRTGAGE
jgi:hypothetical protein